MCTCKGRHMYMWSEAEDMCMWRGGGGKAEVMCMCGVRLRAHVYV